MQMSSKLVSAALLVAGVIHIAPVAGVMGSAQLASLYGLDFSEPNLAILMRHRAILFGMLGVFLVAAAFRRSLQPSACGAGLVSVLSFLLIAWTTGGYNPLIGTIVFADLIALGALVVAVALLAWQGRQVDRVR
jgi:hypothetical protein